MRRKPKLALCLYDGLADFYGMKTLHDYLVEKDFPAELEFVITSEYYGEQKREVVERMLGFQPKICDYKFAKEINPTIAVGGFSDLEGVVNFRRLIKIDLSILKNCVKPIGEKERKQLRTEYQISSEKPIVVVGNASAYPRNVKSIEFEVLESIASFADIYFVGNYNKSAFSEGMKYDTRYGVLRDYYAMADASLMADNLMMTASADMHNFIEATEGGPLFLWNPSYKVQFGYKELRKLKVIREYNSIESLVGMIKKYLKNSESAETRRLRAQHLRQSRKKYLEDITILLAGVLGLTEKRSKSDLQVSLHKSSFDGSFTDVHIFHSATYWGGNYQDEAHPISKVPEEFYEKFRGQK